MINSKELKQQIESYKLFRDRSDADDLIVAIDSFIKKKEIKLSGLFKNIFYVQLSYNLFPTHNAVKIANNTLINFGYKIINVTNGYCYELYPDTRIKVKVLK